MDYSNKSKEELIRELEQTKRELAAQKADLLDYKNRFELAISAANYKYLFLDHKSAMLLIEPRSGKIIDANRSAAVFYKYSIDQLRSMNISQINALSPQQIALEKEKAIKSEKNAFCFPHRLSNGEIRQVEVHSSLIEFNSQQLLFSIIDDITERILIEEKLRHSEEALKKAEEIGKFGHWQFYLNEKVLTSSDGARIIYDFDSNENMLEKVQRQPLPEFRPLLDKALSDLVNHGINYDVEYKIKRESDGKIIDIHSFAKYDKSQNIVFGTIQDISERKSVEEERRLSEEKFRSLYTNMIEGSAMHTLVYKPDGTPIDYRIVEVNPAFESQLGISRETVINKTSREAYGVNEPPYFDVYSRVALSGTPEVFETYFAPLDKYFSISVYCPYKGSFATIFENITERKKTERDLRIILSKYQILFDIFPIGITIANTSGKIIESNKVAEALLGLSIEEQEKRKINGQEWRIIRPTGSAMPASEFASVRALEEHQMVSNVEMGIVKENEQITWLNVSAAPIPIEGYGVAIVYSDISERKQTEIKIQQQNTKLAEANRTKDKFFSIIAHDLRGPLGSIFSFSELLVDNFDEYDNEKKKYYLSLLNVLACQTIDLLENLLDWSRLQRGLLNPDFQLCNINSIISEVVILLEQGAKNKNIQISNNTNNHINILCDKNMLSTILRNLLSNAVKFTPTNGEVSIVTIPKTDSIEFRIKDSGQGIALEKIPDLFNIARNTSTIGTASERGTGIGLPLCKELIEKLGGTIWVESEMGIGSTFYFTISAKG